jgi:hypothetical protein
MRGMYGTGFFQACGDRASVAGTLISLHANICLIRAINV